MKRRLQKLMIGCVMIGSAVMLGFREVGLQSFWIDVIGFLITLGLFLIYDPRAPKDSV